MHRRNERGLWIVYCLVCVFLVSALLTCGDEKIPQGPVDEILDCIEGIEEHKLSVAQEAYEKTKAEDPSGAETYNNRGVVRFLQGESSVAESSFRTAMRRNPDLIGAQMNLGVVFAASGELDSAKVYFAKAQEKAGDILRAQIDYNLVWMHEELEQWTDALARHSSLMANSQANDALKAKSYVCQGIVRAEQGDLEGATSAFQSAIDLDPEGEGGCYGRINLGLALSGTSLP